MYGGSRNKSRANDETKWTDMSCSVLSHVGRREIAEYVQGIDRPSFHCEQITRNRFRLPTELVCIPEKFPFYCTFHQTNDNNRPSHIRICAQILPFSGWSGNRGAKLSILPSIESANTHIYVLKMHTILDFRFQAAARSFGQIPRCFFVCPFCVA